MVMAITYKVMAGRPASADVEVLAIPVTNEKTAWEKWPAGARDKVKQELRRRGWKAGWGQLEVLAGTKVGKTTLLAVIGLGDKASVARQAEGMRRGIAGVIGEAGRLGLKTVGIDLTSSGPGAEVAAAAVEGIEMVSYGFVEHSPKLAQKQKRGSVKQVCLIGREDQLAAIKQVVQKTRGILQGVELARNLVNEPAGHMSPAKLAGIAKEIARQSPQIKVDIMDKERARREKFGAFLAVAGGSAAEPYVIHLQYTPAGADAERKKIWIVGKGITFDSGGLSIKPADNMEFMKGDMAGAALVLGLFTVLEKVAPEVEVHGLIAACENMPSGTAYRPGDVLTALNGKTIEVLNTDAEGRVTLADALSYAAAQKPDAIVDVATLTGACMVALGETVAGLWGNNEPLKQMIVRAGEQAGERAETMPMPEEYAAKLESHVADLQNIPTTRWGGAISAAMFLREFVGEVAWAHLDIAGPSFMEQKLVPYWTRGATGYGVRLLVNLLRELAEKKTVERDTKQTLKKGEDIRK